MARKHFEEYYKKIKIQYHELLSLVKEAGQLTGENAVDPQTIKNLEMVLQPVKNSYMSLAYVEYLLNLPKNKKVEERNRRQFESKLRSIDPKFLGDSTIKENEKSLSDVHEVIDKEMRWYSLTQTHYAKCFTLLDRNESDWVEDSEALDNSNEDIIESSYYNGDYRLLLSADLDKDIYTLEITEE